MKYIQLLSLFYLICNGASAVGNVESCTEDPALAVAAGSELSFKTRNTFGARCSAELTFIDDTPSMTWYFEAAECAGLQLAQLSVPLDVPNGIAYITWQCEEGIMSCNRIVISKGSPVLNTSPRLITKTARCISPTTLMTHVVTPDKGKPTGVYLGTAPTITDTLSTPLVRTPDTNPSTILTPGTPNRPPGYKPLVGTGETRKTIETGARLGRDTSAPTTTTTTTTTPTPATTIITSITNTATVTVPVIIPVQDPTSITSVTTDGATEEPATNKPSYITVTSIISACPTPPAKL